MPRTTTPRSTQPSRAGLVVFALSLPEAWKDEPWEEDTVVKVRKKIFVFFGSERNPTQLGVKLPHSAAYALTLACATPMAYGLGRSGWVTVQLRSRDAPDDHLLRDWIVESYRAVAPKTLARLT